MNNTDQRLVTGPFSDQQNSHHTYNTLTFSEAWESIFHGKISKDKLYSEVRQGKVPHFKVGNKILFRRSTLEAWLQEQERNSLR
jgi:excisionase family DNA binding protein